MAVRLIMINILADTTTASRDDISSHTIKTTIRRSSRADWQRTLSTKTPGTDKPTQLVRTPTALLRPTNLTTKIDIAIASQ